MASKTVLKAAGAMGAATLLSRMMGLVREQVFAFFFGAGNLTDAYQVAFRIPNLLRDLFAEGAMSASLVPVFTRTRIEEGDLRAWRVAGLVFRVLFTVVSILALIGIFFAPQLVDLYASAFKEIPGKFELTVQMTRVMFPFFPLVALAAAFMGVLNACGIFFLPAFASALFNVGSVIVGVGFVFFFKYGNFNSGIVNSWSGGVEIQPIVGMAIGVVAGGVVQAFCQLPALYRVGYRWVSKSKEDPIWRKDPRLYQMMWMMVPGTIGLAATQVNLLVNTILATSQGPGAVSWLNYAFRLMQFPIGIFGVSLASATLPRVSEQWARRNVQGVSETLVHSLRSVFAINLPASAGLAFLGVPIIELIFQYGRFSAADTEATAWALAMYSVGLVAYSTVKVLVPACYALGNTRLPVVSSILSVALTIALNLLMVRPFGYWGLALGTSLAAVFNALFLLIAIQKLVKQAKGEFPFWPLLIAFLQYLGVSLLMGGVCYGTYHFFGYFLWPFFGDLFGKSIGLFSGNLVPRLLQMILLMLEGVALIVISAKVFRLDEVQEMLDHLLKGVKRRKY